MLGMYNIVSKTGVIIVTIQLLYISQAPTVITPDNCILMGYSFFAYLHKSISYVCLCVCVCTTVLYEIGDVMFE